MPPKYEAQGERQTKLAQFEQYRGIASKPLAQRDPATVQYRAIAARGYRGGMRPVARLRAEAAFRHLLPTRW
ncbi:hypothetical protein D3872_22175 [Massilia cavernae]|uniref:Uncharacterized protein n=1 Tax=Massilia cavernae TaxID=2320864 RepID=A0A418XB05_9BURK|nr:hypothetical protein D3872_22175 [Massilia cavernae]